MTVTDDLFEEDALVLENSQAHEVSLVDGNGEVYVTVSFDAPVFGIWSSSPDAPFVCIEPWYGRCDREEYTGEYADRDWTQHLEPGEVFNASYTIEIL